MTIALLRTMLLYIFVVLALRIMGKRQIGELQPSELVVTLLISDLASVPMQETGIPLTSGVIPIFALVSLEVILSCASLRFPRLRRIISGSPVVIVRDGKLLEREMRRVRFTLEDLMESLRQQDVFTLEEVAWAIVETNGQLSILKKPGAQTPTAQMLHLSPPDAGLPVLVVSDGALRPQALELCGLSEQWLEETLRAEQVERREVFLLIADKSRHYQLVRKEKTP